MLADGLGRDLHPEALSKNLSKLGGVPGTFFAESFPSMKVLTSSVIRGELPGAAPSKRPSKPRSSQRSRSRPTLALERPVYAEMVCMFDPLWERRKT